MVLIVNKKIIVSKTIQYDDVLMKLIRSTSHPVCIPLNATNVRIPERYVRIC